MPKACIYAGFRHSFYRMALVWPLFVGESNGVINFEKVNKEGRRYKLCCQQEKKHEVNS